MTSASDEKWRSFNCFFQSREQVVVRRGQIRRIGWVIKTMEAQVGDFLMGSLLQEKTHNSAHEYTPLSKDTIDSVLRHREVGRSKDLSAPLRSSNMISRIEFVS